MIPQMAQRFSLIFVAMASPMALGDLPSQPPISVGGYSVSPDDFVLGYSVKALKNGVNIGHFKAQTADLSTPPASAAQGLSVQLQDFSQQADANSANAMKLVENNKKQMALKLSNGQPNGLGATPTSGVVLTNTASQLPLPSLDDCAMKSMEQLKQKLQIMHRLKDLDGSDSRSKTIATLQQNALLEQLQRTTSPSGMVCGKTNPYLAHLKINSEVDTIKILAAISNRKDKERQQLLQTLALAYGDDVDPNLQATWRLLWMRLSFMAVFSTAALPTWEDIIRDMKTHAEEDLPPVQTAAVTLRPHLIRDFKTVDQDLQNGLAVLQTGEWNVR
jgi:hypothetical protein